MNDADVKAIYMQKAEADYNSAYAQMQDMYDRHRADLQLVIEYWDELLWEMTYMPSGTFQDNPCMPPQLVYEYPYGILDAMGWIRFFICHEIHDDGEPVEFDRASLHARCKWCRGVGMVDWSPDIKDAYRYKTRKNAKRAARLAKPSWGFVVVEKN